MHQSIYDRLWEAAKLIQAARSIVVLSGAGLSQASGIPTYRDSTGLWKDRNNLKYSHISSYWDDSEAFMTFWEPLVKKILTTRPNPAHFALRQLQSWKPTTLLVTQNVDGLLQEAGCTDVVELHGSLRKTLCDHCGLTSDHLLDRCLRCGGDMRPAVTMFGEMLDEEPLTKAQLGAIKSDLIIVIGTTAEVYPAASIPFLALDNKAKFIIIDPNQTSLWDLADVVLAGTSEELLPLLINLCIK